MALRFLAILALLTAAYLIGNGTTSLWDRDEPRYAQASRQMLEGGDWVVPQFLDEPRLKKPAMIYWCQATAMKLFGVNAWSARLPSVIATVLTLCLIAIAIAKHDDARTATWTTFMYGTAVLTIAAAKMAITDAMLTLFVLAALVCVYRTYIGKGGWGTMAALGLSIGLAGLVKGPVVLAVLAATAVALLALRAIELVWPNPQTLPSRVTANELHPLRMIFKIVVVLVCAAAVLAPWIYAIEQKIPGYTLQTIMSEFLSRGSRVHEGHTGPPGYYTALVWVTFFPWSLLLPGAIVEAWRQRHVPAVRFAVAAIIGPWILFECVPTKLPHYVLPMYAPLAYLVARVLIRSSQGDTAEFHQPAWPNVVALWAVVVALVGIAPWAAAFFFHPLPWQTYVALSILSVWAIFYAVKVHAEFARRYPSAAGMWMGLGMLGNVFVLYTLVFPVSQYMRLSERIAAVLPRNVADGDIVMIDYKEPSLAFYQGGAVRERDDTYVLPHKGQIQPDPEHWAPWIVLTRKVYDAMPPDLRSRLTLVKTETGWNYADGRIVEVLVMRRRA